MFEHMFDCKFSELRGCPLSPSLAPHDEQLRRTGLARRRLRQGRRLWRRQGKRQGRQGLRPRWWRLRRWPRRRRRLRRRPRRPRRRLHARGGGGPVRGRGLRPRLGVGAAAGRGPRGELARPRRGARRVRGARRGPEGARALRRRRDALQPRRGPRDRRRAAVHVQRRARLRAAEDQRRRRRRERLAGPLPQRAAGPEPEQDRRPGLPLPRARRARRAAGDADHGDADGVRRAPPGTSSKKPPDPRAGPSASR